MSSIKATWETTCKGCEKVVTKIIELTPETSRLHYFDIWGPGWPENWMQTVEEELNVFFCSSDCFKAWLRKQGRLKEIEEFDKSVWTA